MLCRSIPGRFDAQLPRHPQMHPKPPTAREPEKHLLPVRMGRRQSCPAEAPSQCGDITAAENSRRWMRFDAFHGRPEARIPAATKKVNFSEFRHVEGWSVRAAAAESPRRTETQPLRPMLLLPTESTTATHQSATQGREAQQSNPRLGDDADIVDDQCGIAPGRIGSAPNA
jgi:hypothetical protein